MKVQLEITTACNLNCEYCFRKRENLLHSPIHIAEKIADVDEVVLYGYGEPLLHPQIREVVKMLNRKVMISTNGMVDSGFDDVLSEVERLAISVDFDARHRKGLVFEKLEEKLKKAGEKAITQIVLTKENIEVLDELVEISASNGADIQLSNVVAGNPEMYEKALYFEASKFCVDVVESLDKDFVIKAIRDWSRGKGVYKDEYQKILKIIYDKGYSVNMLYILENRERIRVAREAEKRVESAMEIAKSYGVDFERAEFFGDSKARACPYENVIFIRADGRVSSCMSFAYSHREYVNDHWKEVNEFTVFDLNSGDVDEAFEKISDFEKIRKNMDDGFPWCADCPYVSGCWYAKQNIDCFGNAVSCSECLYSSKIARCVL